MQIVFRPFRYESLRGCQQQGFEPDTYFEPHPFVPQGIALDERCEEVFSIQVSGLAQRLVHTKAKSAVIGISGGLDSTLALLVCVKTFDKLGWSRQGIVGVTMPGFGTTDRTYTNAIDLMNSPRCDCPRSQYQGGPYTAFQRHRP